MSAVKIISYKRAASSSFHIHAGEYAHCFYAPSEQTIILFVQHESFGGNSVSLTTEQRMLDEVTEIMAGRPPQVEGVAFSEVKEIEMDQYALTSLLDDARAKDVLDERVRTGLKQLKELAGA